MANDIAKSFRDVVHGILEAGNVSAYAITLKVFVKGNIIEIPVPRLLELNIVQEFEALMSDYIHVVFELPIHEYVQVLRHEPDLQCEVTIRYVDALLGTVGKVVMSKKFRAVLQDRHDPYKVENAVAMVTNKQQNETITQHIGLRLVRLQLYDATLLNIKGRRFNFLLKSATIANALAVVTDVLKIRLNIVTPDNQHIYKHLIIPPSLTVSEIVKYLQITPGYGIYDQGCSAYYTDGVLYIYPMFDPDPAPMGVSCHFYYVGQDNYVGADSNHRVDDQGNYHIICNSKVQIDDHTALALANYGDSIIIQDSAKIIEQWITPAVNTLTVNTGVFKQLTIPTRKKLFEEQYTPKIFLSDHNTYRIKSVLSQEKSVSAAFHWDNALPGVIKPGSRVIYHYVVVNEFQLLQPMQHVKAPGICAKIVYSFRKLPSNEVIAYTCRASMSVRMHDQDGEQH